MQFMTAGFTTVMRGAMIALLGACAIAAAPPALAQVQSVDPDKAIDADLAPRSAEVPAALPAAGSAVVPADGSASAANPTAASPAAPSSTGATTEPASAAAAQASANPQAAVEQGTTYKQDDLVGAAEGVFGKGAQGLAQMIEDLLKKQGEPNGYIVGREGGGALVVGLRYGSGTLFHKVEGQRPVYWTGPSVGLDIGANGGNAFVLVYNLYNTEDLYKRFPAGEGQIYVLGGFNASYLRRGDIVLIPIRMGVGLRLGLNAGYMKFSPKAKWVPF
ncbi:MAG: hypothetical protein RLZZ84_1071 [Pseudomonadota bacterium]|jgi:hypothetical protein